MIKTDPEILEAIPHRHPMLLIDSIKEIANESITCMKTFHADEYFFQGHFPEHPIVPGVILCECAAQAGAVLLFRSPSLSAVTGTPLLTRMNDVRFKQMVGPSETIAIHVKLEETIGTAYLMSAHIRREGKRVADLQFTCTIQQSSSE